MTLPERNNITHSEIGTVLEQAGLRISPVRILVYKVIAAAQIPVSAFQIEHELSTVDRSSISRTLLLFANAGIVHSVDDGSGAVKYELCRSPHNIGENEDSDLHPHFHCTECKRTFCLDSQILPVITLPDNFRAESACYVIKGLCAQCARDK